MKLEGSLDGFSLPDIFQLLSFTKKTGGLHLAQTDGDGVVFFTSGQITGASADSSRQPLARRLIGSGTVDDDALVAAVSAAEAGEGLGVVRALLEAQAVDLDLLRRAATDQAVDAVFDLLRWQEGDFVFVIDEGNPDDVGITLTAESVLADADSRRVTWETVSKVIPSPRAVLAMPVVLPADPQVSREEWSLLALVDGRRTVSELVDLTGSGQYAVVSTLAALVERGLLQVRPEEGGADDHVAVVVRRQQLLAPLEGQPFVPVAIGSEDDGADVGASDVGASAGQSSEMPGETGEGDAEPELVGAGAEGPKMLGGAHVPSDVVPPRPEPFLPKREAEFDEGRESRAARPVAVQAGPSATIGEVVGATVTAADPQNTAIERDPSVNRSLMLRLIAGVRGL